MRFIYTKGIYRNTAYSSPDCRFSDELKSDSNTMFSIYLNPFNSAHFQITENSKPSSKIEKEISLDNKTEFFFDKIQYMVFLSIISVQHTPSTILQFFDDSHKSSITAQYSILFIFSKVQRMGSLSAAAKSQTD